MPIIDWNSIPGFRDAVERESGRRDAAFLDINETVGGMSILPLTPERFLILDGISSPFVCGGTPAPEDVALLLWVCSEEFSPTDRKVRGRFIKSCRKVKFTQACKDAEKYIQDAFADAPGGGSGGQSYLSWCASMVDIVASEYHWSERDIIKTPLKRLFQYIRAITMRNNPKAIFFNESERIRSAWLAEKNKQRQAAKN
mgnify:CR=1 FL=1|jgi:hypothetical protein